MGVDKIKETKNVSKSKNDEGDEVIASPTSNVVDVLDAACIKVSIPTYRVRSSYVEYIIVCSEGNCLS